MTKTFVGRDASEIRSLISEAFHSAKDGRYFSALHKAARFRDGYSFDP
jgi:hypothetical protein